MTPAVDHERYMRQAIDLARNNPAAPFGAVLIDRLTGTAVCGGWNHTQDSPTFHGEIDVINRHAAAGGGAWGDLTLYTTAEPCPMCMAAILWSGVREVVFGTSIPTLQRLGWWQIEIRAAEVIARAPGRTIVLVGGVLESACDALFAAGPPA